MREYTDVDVGDLDVEAIVAVLDAAPVTRGILFGSYARGDDWKTSDVDLAVEFDSSLSPVDRTRTRLQLIEQIGSALGREDIHVIPLSEAQGDLRHEINDDGIALYGPSNRLDVSDGDTSDTDHGDRIARFDELLGELERVV